MKKLLRTVVMPFAGILLFTFFATKANAQSASVSTDKADYPPGSTVYITGSGFYAGENVTLQVKHDEADSMGTDPQYHQPWTVTADADGNISSSWIVPDDGDALGATFLLTADGQSSGLHAEWVFTDGNGDGTMTVSPTQTCAGSSGINFVFTYQAPILDVMESGSSATISIPAGFTAPTLSNVSVTPTGNTVFAATPIVITGTGPYTIKINFQTSISLTLNGFIVTFSGVTAPAVEGSYTFTSQVDDAGSAGGATNIGVQPVVTVGPPPQPGAISGSTSLCGPVTGTYSISAVTGATSYNWIVPAGWSITSGQGATSINVITGPTGTISVTASNNCGTSPARTLPVTQTGVNDIGFNNDVNNNALTICTGTNPITINGGDASSTPTYSWQVDDNPGFTSPSTAAGTSTGQNYTVSSTYYNTQGIYYFRRVSSSSGCNGNSDVVILTVNGTPSPTTAITGSASVCSADNTLTYSVPAVIGASYTWAVPTGWAINSGQNTNSITVTSGVAGQIGNITVTVSNSCGTGNGSLAINFLNDVGYGGDPTANSATTCQGVAPSQQIIGGAAPSGPAYQWQVSINGGAFANISAATAQNYTISSTYYNTAGTYKFHRVISSSTTACDGNSDDVTLIVNALPTVNALSGAQTVCAGSTTTFSSTTGGGVWGTDNAGVATVAGGVVTGISAGTANISYSVSNANACSTTVLRSVTVYALPTATGVTICQGSSSSFLTSSTVCADASPVPSGFNNAGSGANVPIASNADWSNPTNITAVGTPYATVSLAPGANSDYLQGTNYHFNIPLNASIKGIEVLINRNGGQSLGFGFLDNALYLVKNVSGAPVIQTSGSNKASATLWSTGFTTATYGSPTDSWNLSWLPSDINNGNFGVALSVHSNLILSTLTATVDYMQINVTYTVPGNLNWYTVSSGGTVVQTGSPFDPINDPQVLAAGTPYSNLGNTNTAGTYTFYAECATAPGCRAAADFVINPTQTLTGASQHDTVCAGSGAEIDLTGLLANTTSTIEYSINDAAQTPVTGVVADADGNASFTTPNLVAANNGQTLQITGITVSSSTPSCTKSFAQNVTLGVNSASVIAIQPTNQTTTYGTPASFSVVATGTPAPTYQWEVNVGDGSGFFPIDDATSATFSIDQPTVDLSGFLFHVIVTNSCSTVVSDDVSLTVHPLAVTLSANDTSKTYGDENPTFEATVTGTINDDVLDYTLGTTATQFSNIGDYPITVTLGDNPNYSVTTTDATLNITPKTATVAANNNSKTYGDDNPTFGATVTGTVNGDVLDYTLGTTATQFSNVGDYPITVTLGANPNYTVTPTDATLNIAPKTATVAANNNSKTYGDDNPTFDATVTGTVNGDVLDYTLGTTATQFSNVGDYPITVTLGANPNYTVTPANGTLHIDPKTATVAANNNSKTYGDDNPAFDATVTGTVNGDVLDYTLGTTATQFSNVGDYPITVTLGVNPNYTVTPANGTLHIDPKTATVTANNKSKTYGDDNPTFDATVTGTVNGDVLDYTLSTTATQFSNVGDYPITVTLSANPNYSVTPANGTLHIDPKTATVAANDKSKTYGDDNPAFDAAVTGTVNGDVLDYTLGTTATQFSNIGDYPITVTLGVNPNYSVTPANGTLHINPKAASVTPIAAGKHCGDADPVLTGILDGFIASDNVTAIYTRTPGETVAGSPYTISATLSPAGVLSNYTITNNTAPFTITDVEAPVISALPGPSIINCPATPSFATATATDCSPYKLTYADVTTFGSCAGNYTVTRTWTATDSSHNVSTASQTITVQDVTAPTFTRPADKIIYTDANCNYNASPSVTGDVTNESDYCSTGLNATYTDMVTNGPFQGSYVITRTWHLVDNCGNAAADQVQTITVKDNIAPTFTRPADKTVYTTASCTYNASVAITGDVTDEHDNCSTGLQATYTDVISNGPYTGSNIIKRTWHLKDNSNNAAADQVQTITVSDNTGPVVSSVAASPNSLWPPNHKMQTINLTYTSSDNCSGSSTSCVVTVTSNEPINGTGDGDTSPDWIIDNNKQVQLRSERSGTGNGRIYTITVTCKDAAGNPTIKSTTVTVAHDQGLSLVAAPALTQPTKLEVKIMPNPSVRSVPFTLTVKGKANEEIEMRVLNMLGQVVYNTKGAPNETYKFGSQFMSGIYLVEVRQGENVQILKVIKQ